MSDFSYGSNYVQDQYGFGVPRLGGNVAVRYATVTFADTTAATLFSLPEGAVITDITVEVTTAFDAGTTNVLDIGLGADGDFFANDVDVSSAAVVRYGDTGFIAARAFGTPLTAETDVTALFAQTGTAATEGTAVVAISYIRK